MIMIRKLKNILKPHDSSSIESTNSHCSYDVASTDSISSYRSTNTDKSKHGSPKINFIKRKLKSTKSWVRPKHGKFEESTYDDVLPEPADHEFESYTKNNYIFAQQNSSTDNYMDYGFKMPYRLNSQVSLSSKTNETDSNNYKSSCSNSNSYLESNQSQESYRYFKIIQKLTKSSLNSPANVPILCTNSFNQNDSNWQSLSKMLCTSAQHSSLKLIVLTKGEPINAMFYFSELDLIYVKTADDLEGFLPRSHCKLFSQNENTFNEYLKPKLNYTESCHSSINSASINKAQLYGSHNDHNESIKYHSLSSSEYDDLNEEHVYSNIPINEPRLENMQTFLQPITNSFTTIEADERRISNLYQIKPVRYDSGYRSDDVENSSIHPNSILVNDYEEKGSCMINKCEISPEKMNQHLFSMQSRSRLPISISSNLNFEIMDDNLMLKKMPEGFENFTYKASPVAPSNKNRLSIALTPKTNKNTRRSLDACITNSCQKLTSSQNYFRKNSHYQPNMTDLDVNKIELDSITEAFEKNLSNNNLTNQMKCAKTTRKHWHVIHKHEAKSHQEISVEPGMLVLVIREHNEWLYIKLTEDGSFSSIQKYGFIPRTCAVDLDELSHRTQNNQCDNERKPQITAL